MAANGMVTFFTELAGWDIMWGRVLTQHAEREGAVIMASYSVDAEPGVVSELVDLDPIPLSALRKLNHATLHRSLRHVVTQTTTVTVTASSGQGSERLD